MKIKCLIILALLLSGCILCDGQNSDPTEYQKGASDGLKAGMRMGVLLGAAPYDPVEAQKFNSMVDRFNQGLGAIFGNNLTAIDMFWLDRFSESSSYTSVGSSLSNQVSESQSSSSEDWLTRGSGRMGRPTYPASSTPVTAYGAYLGNSNTKVYHNPSCSWADNISPEHRVWFSSPEEARSYGYRPCQKCNPP